MSEDEISAAEEESLNKFRARISEEELHCPGRDDDQLLLRFLRARLLDLNKASHMYKEYIHWRQQNSVQSVLQEFSYPELHPVLKAWPQAWHKVDKHGRPVNIQLCSRLNVEALFNATSEERLLRRGIWVLEDLHEHRLPACSKAAGHYIGRATIIIDLNDVGISTFANAKLRRTLSNFAYILAQYYPEYLGKMIIVNAPVAFKVIWQMLSPFIDEKTRKKISIHKKDGSQDLLSFVDADNLPSFLGGNCLCHTCQELNA